MIDVRVLFGLVGSIVNVFGEISLSGSFEEFVFGLRLTYFSFKVLVGMNGDSKFPTEPLGRYKARLGLFLVLE